MDTTHSLNRRGFVTVGAVLAAGGLALPRTAHGATVALLARPETDSDLLAHIQAILDRPLAAATEAHPVCDCTRCQAGRAAAFECLACAFSGEPVVWPCDCLRQWEQTIAYWTEVVTNWQGPTARLPESRRHYRRWLAKVKGERPATPCADGYCAHGSRTCPVCGAAEGDTDEEAFRLTAIEHTGPATMIRELRAVLRSAARA